MVLIALLTGLGIVRIGEHIDTRIRYGSTWFWRAAALPLAGLLRDGRLVPLVRVSLRRPGDLVVLGLILLRTRSEQLRLSETPSGRAIHDYLSQRAFGVIPANRLCRGVIPLPDSHGEYVRGRHRQALRTNLRRAAASGISCETATDRARALRELFALDRRRAHAALPDHVRESVSRAEVTLMVARDTAGRPIAMAAVVIDDTVCLIRAAIATSHEGRWALHDYLVRTLIEQGVRYLLAEGGGPFGALGAPHGVQHYQHLLGYELRHLRAARPRATRRRRVVGTIVLAAVTGAPLVVPTAAGGAM